MFTGICHGKKTPCFAEVATTEKKVPPIPTASAGTKLAQRRATHNWIEIISRAARYIRPSRPA